MQTIIKKPLITEKATSASEKLNRFTFEVDRKANKIEIKMPSRKCMEYMSQMFVHQIMAVVNPL